MGRIGLWKMMRYGKGNDALDTIVIASGKTTTYAKSTRTSHTYHLNP